MNGLSRRHLLCAGGLGILTGLPHMRPAKADPLNLPIGVQAELVQNELKKDFEGTVKALVSIGYRRIELPLPSEAEAIATLGTLRKLGMAWESAHLGSAQTILVDFEARLDLANKLGLRQLVCTILGLRDPSRVKVIPSKDNFDEYAYAFSKAVTLDDWAWTAETLNRAGELARKAGIQLAYHNEPIDFRQFGSIVAYDELLARTDPNLVHFELDCGNAVTAGVDPIAYIEKYADRIILLHVKDVKHGHKPSTFFSPEMKFDFTELGTGSVDWRRVFGAAKKARLEGYYVEQGPPLEKPELESAKINYAFLHALNV